MLGSCSKEARRKSNRRNSCYICVKRDVVKAKETYHRRASMTHTHTHTHTQATGAIAEQIKKDFGSYDEFKKQFET